MVSTLDPKKPKKQKTPTELRLEELKKEDNFERYKKPSTQDLSDERISPEFLRISQPILIVKQGAKPGEFLVEYMRYTEQNPAGTVDPVYSNRAAVILSKMLSVKTSTLGWTKQYHGAVMTSDVKTKDKVWHQLDNAAKSINSDPKAFADRVATESFVQR